MAGWATRDIAHTVLPLHLTTVCDLNFQSCSHNNKKQFSSFPKVRKAFLTQLQSKTQSIISQYVQI